jgi:hypothetical protein
MNGMKRRSGVKRSGLGDSASFWYQDEEDDCELFVDPSLSGKGYTGYFVSKKGQTFPSVCVIPNITREEYETLLRDFAREPVASYIRVLL